MTTTTNPEAAVHPQDGRPLLHLETRPQWRAWLEQNHRNSDGVWLVSWKKAAQKPSIPYSETVDEALCFGWIDSRTNRLDEHRSMLRFTPRNPKSAWSRVNKQKIARLIEEGLMTPAGLSLVEAAKANGSWTVYDEIEDLATPADLASALARNPTAQAFFQAFPGSSKKNLLWWIKSARKPETRAARIEKLVRLAAENRMANHPAGRDRGPSP